MKDCLEDSREQPGFTPECKQELENMMERRAKDVRLDTVLMAVRRRPHHMLHTCAAIACQALRVQETHRADIQSRSQPSLSRFPMLKAHHFRSQDGTVVTP